MVLHPRVALPDEERVLTRREQSFLRIFSRPASFVPDPEETTRVFPGVAELIEDRVFLTAVASHDPWAVLRVDIADDVAHQHTVVVARGLYTVHDAGEAVVLSVQVQDCWVRDVPWVVLVSGHCQVVDAGCDVQEPARSDKQRIEVRRQNPVHVAVLDQGRDRNVSPVDFRLVDVAGDEALPLVLRQLHHAVRVAGSAVGSAGFRIVFRMRLLDQVDGLGSCRYAC